MFYEFDKEMCHKYVGLAGGVLIFSFITSASTVSVEIDGVIDFGKKLSYQYKVVIPEEKDKSMQTTTQYESMQAQEQMQKQSRKKVQSSIQKLSLEHKQSEEQEESQVRVQTRIVEQPIHEHFQIDDSLHTQYTSNTHFNFVNKRLVGQESTSQKDTQTDALPKEMKQTWLQEQPKIQEQIYLADDMPLQGKSSSYFNSVNKHLLIRQPQTPLDNYDQKQELEHPGDFKQSWPQKQPQKQERLEINGDLQKQGTLNPYFHSVNKRLIGLQPQMPKQIIENEHSQKSEQPGIYQQSWLQEQPQIRERIQLHSGLVTPQTSNTYFYSVPQQEHSEEDEKSQDNESPETLEESSKEQSKTQEQFQINEDSETADISQPYVESVNKHLLDERTQIPKQPENNEESRIKKSSYTHERLVFKEHIQSLETPISYFNSVNKRLEEQQAPPQQQINLQQETWEQRKLTDQPTEHEPVRKPNRSQMDDDDDSPEHEDLVIQEYGDEIQQKQPRLQENLQTSKETKTQNAPKPYLSSINEMREQSPNPRQSQKHDQSQAKEQLIKQQMLQVQEQLQIHQRLQQTLNPYFNSVNKRLSNAQAQLPDRSQSNDHSVEDNLRIQKQSPEESQEQYRSQVKLSQIKNLSLTQELIQPQLQSHVQERSHSNDKNIPNPYFISVNKRLTDKLSKSQEQLNVHRAPNIQVTSNPSRNLQDRYERPRSYKTKNPYFQSINKRLTDEQSEVGQPLSVHATTMRYLHSVSRPLTNKHLKMEELSRMQVTTSRYFQSVNKRITNDQPWIQKHLQKQEHNSMQITPNKYIHSVNKRLTTEDHNNERDRSNYEDYVKDWFETIKIFTTTHTKPSSHHHRHEHHSIHTVPEFAATTELDLPFEYDEYSKSEIKSTVFVDLTIRKEKHHKTTTISHKHHHHRHKTTSKDYVDFDTVSKDTVINMEYTEPNTENPIPVSRLLREKKIYSVSDMYTLNKHQQEYTTTGTTKGFKISQTDKSFLNMLTIENFNIDILREEINSTKKIHIIDNQIARLNFNTSNPENTTENIYSMMATQIITNLTFNEIFSHPKKIKYDTQINTFTSHILQSGLNVFAVLKDKTSDYALKDRIDVLAEKYENKYKEFLADTNRHEIKTKLGKQKVILNAIDVSDRILRRLVNFIVADMDQKGNLRDNIGTAINFQQEVDKERDLELNHVCKKFGICRNGDGFPDFLIEFTTILLKCDDTKFKLAMDSLTEATKNMDFSDTFPRKTRHLIKAAVNRAELRDVDALRPSLMIIKNIIANKNRPIIIGKSESQSSRINSTLALLETIDILEGVLPRIDTNIIDWGDLRTSLSDWAHNNQKNVVEIMGNFVTYIKSAMLSLPAPVREHIADNFERILNAY